MPAEYLHLEGLLGDTGVFVQVRFGARSGAAPVFLGLLKIVLGLLFGSSLYQLLKAFPQPMLGSLMIFSGAHGSKYRNCPKQCLLRPIVRQAWFLIEADARLDWKPGTPMLTLSPAYPWQIASQ